MPTPRFSGKTLAVGAFSAVAVALGVGAVFALGFGADTKAERGAPPTSLGPEQQGPGDRSAVYRAEQAVEVWHAGKWYRGRVHAVASDKYFVTFDGFSKSWHEWVDPSRLRATRD